MEHQTNKQWYGLTILTTVYNSVTITNSNEISIEYCVCRSLCQNTHAWDQKILLRLTGKVLSSFILTHLFATSSVSSQSSIDCSYYYCCGCNWSSTSSFVCVLPYCFHTSCNMFLPCVLIPSLCHLLPLSTHWLILEIVAIV